MARVRVKPDAILPPIESDATLQPGTVRIIREWGDEGTVFEMGFGRAHTAFVFEVNQLKHEWAAGFETLFDGRHWEGI